jgi:hypothetical protein
MDRDRAGRRLNTGLAVAAVAVFMFGLTFFAAINYIA